MPARPEDADRVKSISVTPEALEKIKRYAEANTITMSAAAAEIITAVAKGSPLPVGRRRFSKRLSVWVDPKVYLEFTRRVKKEGTTIGRAIEAAAEELM